MLGFLMIQERGFQPGFPFRSRHDKLWHSELDNKSRKYRSQARCPGQLALGKTCLLDFSLRPR